MLLNCRGNCAPAQSGIYLNLRMLVRQRRKLVNMTTGIKNRIHTIVDRIFPYFLNESKSGIAPFSKYSLLSDDSTLLYRTLFEDPGRTL